MLAALSGAGQAGRDIFADILSNYPGDDRIYDLLVERFAMREEKRALFASYLAKLGDDRAIPMLKEAAQSRISIIWIMWKWSTPSRSWAANVRRSANFPATRTMNLSDAYKRLNAHVLFPKEELLS